MLRRRLESRFGWEADPGRAREGGGGVRVAALFLTHLEDGRFGRLPLERATYLTARAWLSGFQIAAQTLDALHLAVAASHDLEIATADAGMARAAASLGMRVHHVRLPETGEKGALRT